jgi:hypothetical protein
MMRLSLAILFCIILVALSGCIQQKDDSEKASLRAVTEEWKPDGLVSDGEYSRKIELKGRSRQGYSGGVMEISWKNDYNELYMAMDGSTEGWVSVGFEPSEWMKDADVIAGQVKDGRAEVQDRYATGRYGPHPDDIQLGGTDDILDRGGREDGGHTVIEFKRRLATGDSFDKILLPGQDVSIIWAMGSSDQMDAKHDVAYGEAVISLTDSEVNSTSTMALSTREAEGMKFIFAEEKAARDLYLSFYEQSGLSTFQEVAGSEQNHMDSVLMALDDAGIKEPPDEAGDKPENATLKRTYDDLLAEGRQSPKMALRAAAAFEEMSIKDLEIEISAAQDEDVKALYQDLLSGSRKHLHIFEGKLH